MKEKIINGLREGYCEYYHYNGKLGSKGNCMRDKMEGYWEYYYIDGSIWCKGDYNKGKYNNYWEIYSNSDSKIKRQDIYESENKWIAGRLLGTLLF